MSRNCDIAAIWRRHRFDNLRSRTSPPATTSAVPVTEAVAETEAREETEEPEETEALIVEAVDALAARDPGAGGRIRLEIARVPWPVPAVSADLDLLSLAVDNVLGNAAKYSSSGPIEVRLREEAGAVVIEVADSGRGIPAADLPQVFDELARATNARDVAGSGLGQRRGAADPATFFSERSRSR